MANRPTTRAQTQSQAGEPTSIPVSTVNGTQINLDARKPEALQPPLTPERGAPDDGLNAAAGAPVYEALTTGAIPMTVPTPPRPLEEVPVDRATAAAAWEKLLSEDELEEMDALHDWWAASSQADAESCLAKLYEYGSSDFDIMAQSMIAVGGAAWTGAADQDKARIGREMAVLFYLQGKVARAFGALQKGRIPSNDTYDDITRYSMILRRVRQTGKWGA